MRIGLGSDTCCRTLVIGISFDQRISVDVSEAGLALIFDS